MGVRGDPAGEVWGDQAPGGGRYLSSRVSLPTAAKVA